MLASQKSCAKKTKNFNYFADFCRTPGYKFGRCISIFDCSYLLDILKQKPLTQQSIRFLQQSQCDAGFPISNNIPYVCCARNDDSLILQPTAATAVQPQSDIKDKATHDDIFSSENENFDDSIDSASNSSGLLPSRSECGQEFIVNRIYSGQVSLHRCC